MALGRETELIELVEELSADQRATLAGLLDVLFEQVRRKV
jgi:hypothetical protein